MRIRYSSAPCGSGKTYQIVNRAVELAESGAKVLILLPTKELIDKTVAEELEPRADCPVHRVFHGDTMPDGKFVAQELAAYLQDPQDCGQIVFATHQVLPLIQYCPTKGDWNLIIDECPQITRCDTHRIPNTHEIVTGDLKIGSSDSIYGTVSAKHRTALEKKARNRDSDELLDALGETLRIIASPHWQSYVNLEQYEKLKSGKVKTLTFHSILDPGLLRGFASVFVAAADLQDSELFQLWNGDDVRFEPDGEYTGRLRFAKHENGANLTIYYFFDEDWSKKKMDHETDDGRTVLGHMVTEIQKLFGAGAFLWQANKSVLDSCFQAPAIRLPGAPHGLNTYSRINDIAFLSALNPTPTESKFLESRTLTRDDIRRFRYYAVAYQAVMRTSLRDPNNHEAKRIVVPDAGLANYLAEKFPGATIKKLDIGNPFASAKPVGRPKIHKSNAAKSEERRREQKEHRRQLLNQMLNLNSVQDNSGGSCHPRDTKTRIENPIDIISNFDTALCRGTLYKSTRSPEPAGYLACVSDDRFIGFLASWHDLKFDSKDDNLLISPAIFDPSIEAFNDKGKRTKRGRGNIVQTRHIWLDFENGDLKPKEFAELFPFVRMIVANSYRHTADKPRFRVIMLTTKPMTADVHEALFDLIEAKLKDAGYVTNPGRGSNYARSGLDRSKRSATSLFYLPCQAEDPKQSFILDQLETKHSPIDPEQWVKNGNLPIRENTVAVTSETRDVDQSRLDAAISNWRQSANVSGAGNRQFFLFAVELKKLGMEPDQIRSILLSEAQYGRSPQKRRNQLPSIMGSLFGSRAAA